MKKTVFLIVCVLLSTADFAQSRNSKAEFPAYIEKGTIPDFTVFAAPDSTLFTQKDLEKNKPLLLMIFSPKCGHCQHETELIEQQMDHFENAQILMVTWMPYNTLVPFSKKYRTVDYPNITLVHDPSDFFYDFYEVHRYPKIVVYNKNGDYVSDYSGNIDLEDVWKDLGGK